MIKKKEKSEKIFYKEGDEVAHKENPSLKMNVKAVLFKDHKIPGTDKSKKFLIGIRCAWWKSKEEYVFQIFHSRELVPWNIAEKGKEAIIEWLNS
jgi:hypothetical protein